jgi:DUF438 domain-containing protein
VPDIDLMAAMLDSLKDPYVFADTDHVIRYMNKVAIEHYGRRWGYDLIGKSLLDCHDERSRQMLEDILSAMRDGEEERLVTDNAKHRIYMRAVRGADGKLLGYCERYEPPRGDG